MTGRFLVLALALGVAHGCAQENIFRQTCSDGINLSGRLAKYGLLNNKLVHTSSCLVGSDYFPEQCGQRTYEFTITLAKKESQEYPIQESVTTLAAPESFVVFGDIAYTGSLDGFIYKVDLKTKEATQVTSACYAKKAIHGCRPLGMRLSADGNTLYFADKLAGLCIYDLVAQRGKVVVPLNTQVDGVNVTYPNDLDVDEANGIIYFSDQTTAYSPDMINRALVMHDISGRVLQYDIKTGKTTVFANQISLPNGIQITHDQKALLVTERGIQRVLKYSLGANDRGSKSVFTANTIGNGDNIRAASDGGYWLAINYPRVDSEMGYFDSMGTHRCTMEHYIQLQGVVADNLDLLDKITGLDKYKIPIEGLRNFDFIAEASGMAAGIPATVLKLDANGAITDRFVNPNYEYFATAVEYDGTLLIGNDVASVLQFYEPPTDD